VPRKQKDEGKTNTKKRQEETKRVKQTRIEDFKIKASGNQNASASMKE